MRKRSRTYRTSWAATSATKRHRIKTHLALCGALLLIAVSGAPPAPTLTSVLAARKAAVAQLHLHDANSVHTMGILSGSSLIGRFQYWQSGDDSREIESIGARQEETFSLGDRSYAINESGDVRQLDGMLREREITQDFALDGDFAAKPQYDKFIGQQTLPDGRTVFALTIAPPDGQPETLDLDTKTLLVDRLSYEDADGISTQDYYDYTVDDGVLVAQREIDSNGDHQFDVHRNVTRVLIDGPTPPGEFVLPPSSVVQTVQPVTVSLREEQGHFYVPVRIGSDSYWFLLDTGAQSIALDTRVAQQQHLAVAGSLEVAGARRIGGLGIAALPSLQVGGVEVPARSVAVLDLTGATGAFQADGVLGYPFFAAAEVTIDPLNRTMTFGKPGSLHAPGAPIPIDVDRELVETQGSINNVPARLVIDTGNSTELLVYQPFFDAHPYLVPLQDRERAASDFGVGGSMRADFAYIDEVQIGAIQLYNRYANLMLSDRGAFADRFDAGNVGMGTLRNFVMTFDEANRVMYLSKEPNFDDGRYRVRRDLGTAPGF